mgnify:CR=1 FL=1
MVISSQNNVRKYRRKGHEQVFACYHWTISLPSCFTTYLLPFMEAYLLLLFSRVNFLVCTPSLNTQSCKEEFLVGGWSWATFEGVFHVFGVKNLKYFFKTRCTYNWKWKILMSYESENTIPLLRTRFVSFNLMPPAASTHTRH